MSDQNQHTTISAIINTPQPQHVDLTQPPVPQYQPRLLTQLTHAEHKPVGKVFSIDPLSGGMQTESSVAVSLWKARTLQVDTLEQMANLVANQSADQALILDQVKGMGAGTDFWLASEKLITDGWQPLDGLPVRQLTKREFSPSGWVVLDWDHDPSRPVELKDGNVYEWWDRVCGVVPEFQGAGRIMVPSSKSRLVDLDGKPKFETPSYHVYIQTENRHLVENVGKMVEARFWLAGQGYKKDGKGGAELRRTPFDPCTWSVSRRVFESTPVVMPGCGLGLAERDVQVVPGEVIDLSKVPVLSESEVIKYRELTERQVSYTGQGGDMRVNCTSATLTMDTLVETKEYGELSVRQYMEQGLEKERCQTPFRESDSWAGYLNRHEPGVGVDSGALGAPFFYDVGTGTKYVLSAGEVGMAAHGDTIAEGIAGLSGGTGGAVDFTVPADPVVVEEVTHFTRLRDGVTSVDVSNPDAVTLFIDDMLLNLDGLQLDMVAKSFSGHARPVYTAEAVRKAIKRARVALGARGREARVAAEKADLRIKQQVQQVAENAAASDPAGIIHNPSLGLSADAVEYPVAIVDAEGKVDTVFPVTQNLRRLCVVLDITIQRNLMTHSTEILMPGYTFSSDDPRNHAYESLKDTAISSGLPTERIQGMISTIASEHQYHPMLAWLDRCEPWDGVTDWIGQLCQMVGVVEGAEASRDTFLRKWLLSGIAFLKGWERDGVNHQPKGVLTLAGSQHIGKTAFLAKICPNKDWFLEGHLLQPGDKDSEKLYASHFLVELGEVDSTFRKSDIAALKAFLSKGRDDMRLPYDKEHVTWERRTLPCATVNKLDFLTDETGNSRFWPIECLSFDFPGLNAFYATGGVMGLWKQAEALYDQEKGTWWLNENGEKAMLAELSENHRQVGAVEQSMIDHWDFSGWVCGVHSMTNIPDGWRIMKASEIAIEIGYGASGPGGRFGVAGGLRQVLANYTGQNKGKTFRCKNDTTGESIVVKGWRIPPVAQNTQFLSEL